MYGIRPSIIGQKGKGEGALVIYTMCNAEKQRCVMNEILLCLQKELEGMGSSLELFGLPTPNMEFPCREGTKNNIRRNVLC